MGDQSATKVRPRRPSVGDPRSLAAPITEWLVKEERLLAGRTTHLMDRFARRLIEASLPLDRLTVHIPQLHPQLAGRTYVWDRDAGGAIEVGYEHSVQNFDVYLASPVKLIYEGEPSIRRRLEHPDCPIDFPILKDLKERNFTDYAIVPVPFSGNRMKALSMATGSPGGFDDTHIAVLDEVLPAFAAVLELQQMRRTSSDLLNTYVGPSAGQRVINGDIRRGEGEIIHAVVWYCDLRGFTAFSETEPLDEVISLLNGYFDRIAAPVVENGGEILKFIGDAMLAIFPCEADGAATCNAVESAITAAEAAVRGVATLNAERCTCGLAQFQCGVAVNIGEAMYGNVGAADRLDFTVIGPAVNLVSRIETLCATLGHPIVASASLAKLSSREFVSLGRHALKGIAEPQEVFALADAPGYSAPSIA